MLARLQWYLLDTRACALDSNMTNKNVLYTNANNLFI